VETAFLEGGTPDLRGAVETLAARGVTHIVVIPYFLTLGVASATRFAAAGGSSTARISGSENRSHAATGWTAGVWWCSTGSAKDLPRRQHEG